jgi:lysozyme
MINTIIDIYHQNAIDLQAAKDGGVIAVIHKATEGATIRDSRYQDRRTQAKALGLLWGAFHFSSGGSVSDQVEIFLAHATPTDDDLISLDWEPSTNGPNMPIEDARHFVQMIRDETGRWPVIYGGALLRESISHQPDPILANCPLWYSRYANAPVGIPTQVWPTYTLWQYTDGDVGPQPHDTPGAGAGIDRNIFQGTASDLRAQWPFTKKEDGAPPGSGFATILSSAVPVMAARRPPPPTARKKQRGKK